MKLFAFNRVDAAIGKPFLWITVAWCRLTGLSQFTLARLGLLAGQVALSVYEILHPDVWNIILLVFGVFVLVSIIFIWVPEWERAEDQWGREVLPTVCEPNRSLRFIRPACAFLIPVGGPKWVAANVAWTVGFYALTVYGPRKPAIWKQAVEALRFRMPRLAVEGSRG